MSKKREKSKNILKKDIVEAPEEKIKGNPKDQPAGKVPAKPKGRGTK